MRGILGVILCLPILFWGGLRIYKSVVYGIDCGGHIKRAADANTVQLATQELKTVIAYLEREGMTSGYTSILYRTPDADVGFWYTNLKSCLEELEKITPETTQLERSNLLLKLRETLLDKGDSGESATEPPGISVYPNNVGYCFFGTLSTILALVGAILFVTLIDWDWI